MLGMRQSWQLNLVRHMLTFRAANGSITSEALGSNNLTQPQTVCVCVLLVRLAGHRKGHSVRRSALKGICLSRNDSQPASVAVGQLEDHCGLPSCWLH